jgi:hypothetical protein
MSQSYVCTNQRCKERELQDLGEVIDHLRTHGGILISRPAALGVSDSHGHLWYCFSCETNLAKDHRSFRSDRAMWDHLNACHGHMLHGIRLSE